MALPQLSTVQVSPENILDLFKDARRKSRSAATRTELLLDRLQSFHKPTYQQLTLRDDSELKAPFRLLCEHSLRYQKPANRTFVSYIALSYCWHDQDWERVQSLGQDTGPWPISTRVFAGLLKERQSFDEGIWIDTLCINQKNEYEKRHAIAYMDLVYKSARKIVVVLEDVEISMLEEEVLTRLLSDRDRDYADIEREFSDLETNTQKEMAKVLIRILSARWFKRAWCAHEMLVSDDFVFLIPTMSGIYRMTRKTLVDLYSLIDEVSDNHKIEDGLDINTESYGIVTRALYAGTDQTEQPLMSQFNKILKLGCTIESDKISIALNVANLQLSYLGNNVAEDQCYWILAMIALSSGDATALCGVDGPLKLNGQDGMVSMDSWLNRNDDFKDPMGDFGGSKLQKASGIHSIEFGAIMLDLFYFPACYFYSTRADIDFGKPTAGSIERAEAVVIEYIKQRKNDDSGYYYDANETERISMIEFLACVLECGTDWLLGQKDEFLKLLNYDMSELTSWELGYDWNSVSDTLFGLSEQLTVDHGNFSNDDKQAMLGFIILILRSSIQFGSGPTSYLSRVCKLGEGGKGILFSGDGVSEQRFSMCAVPVALSGSSCAMSPRLWILDKVDQDPNSLRIVEKLPFFTLKEIAEDAPNIMRLNRVVITGNNCAELMH